MSEPKLMPYQDQPFNGDSFICNKFLELKEEFGINVAVETGSCLYTTTKFLGENFDRVYTVEINKEFASHGKHRIEGMKNVLPSIDDSVRWMKRIMESHIKEDDRAIFFLDAHWGAVCPLQNELMEIANIKSKKPPIITIHDFYTGNPELGFDKINGQPFTWDWIKPSITYIENKLGCKFTHSFNTQAEGAKRGIVYITPNK